MLTKVLLGSFKVPISIYNKNLFCACPDQMVNIFQHLKVKLSSSGKVYVHHLRVNFKMPKLCSHKIATVWNLYLTFLPSCKWRKTIPSQESLHDLCNSFWFVCEFYQIQPDLANQPKCILLCSQSQCHCQLVLRSELGLLDLHFAMHWSKKFATKLAACRPFWIVGLFAMWICFIVKVEFFLSSSLNLLVPMLLMTHHWGAHWKDDKDSPKAKSFTCWSVSAMVDCWIFSAMPIWRKEDRVSQWGTEQGRHLEPAS